MMDNENFFIIAGKPFLGDPAVRYIGKKGFVIYDGFTATDSCYQMTWTDSAVDAVIVSEVFATSSPDVFDSVNKPDFYGNVLTEPSLIDWSIIAAHLKSG